MLADDVSHVTCCIIRIGYGNLVAPAFRVPSVATVSWSRPVGECAAETAEVIAFNGLVAETQPIEAS
jgi:hypothetical protein